jgi:hypothetical protein
MLERCSGGGGASRHLAAHPLRSELGFVGGECGSGEPRALSHRPPPLFIAQGDGGPPAIDRLGVPDQGASQGSRRSLGFL